MVNFISDIENKKGQLVFNSEVDSIYMDKEKIKFSINKNNFFSTRILINCSGLQKSHISKKIKQLDQNLIPKINFCKR